MIDIQLHIFLFGIFKQDRKNRSKYECRRIDRAAGGIVQVASDGPNGIIWTAPFSLTGNRGEYFRVVGIHGDG